MRRHIVPFLGKTPLEELRPELLQHFYLEKQKEGLSGRSIEFIHVVLHGALGQALHLGYVPHNVCDCVKPPWKKTGEIEVLLSREELERFLAVAQKHRPFPAFYLLATTGLRRGNCWDCGGRMRIWNGEPLT